jgi:hypothetical protein
MEKASFIDASRPSAGRIYDYLLGGHHNFKVDRRVAEQLVKAFPFLPKTMRLQRWCLQDLEELTEKRSFDVIVDFASGLPTKFKGSGPGLGLAIAKGIVQAQWAHLGRKPRL